MFTGRKLPLTLAFVVLVALAFGASCKGFFVDAVLTTITVGPTGQNVQVGDTLQMSARGTYDDGSPPKNITGKVLWSTDDTSVATIDKSGLLTGVASGNVTVTANLDTITGTADENVVLTGVTAITIQPHTQNVNRGSSVTYTCEATVSGQSKPVDITATVDWTSDDTANITISSGTSPVTAQVGNNTTLGNHTITATYTVGTTTFTDTATLTVN